MASINTGIQLQDNFSGPMYNIINSVNVAMPVMQRLQQVMNTPISGDFLNGAINSMRTAVQAATELNNAVDGINLQKNVNLPVNPVVSEQADIKVPDNINVPVTPVVSSQAEINVPDSIKVPVTPIVGAQPEIDIPDNIKVPVTPVVSTQPEIDIPDNIKVPVTPVVSTQPEISVPDNIKVPVTPVVTSQPEISVPDNVQIPVTPVVTSQPEINVPDNVQVPVTPVVNKQPDINVPDNIQVPVTPVVTSQADINVPDNIQVPVTPVVTSQADINVPDNIKVPVTPVVTSQPEINVPDNVQVPVTPVVISQPEINVPDNIQVPVTPVVNKQPEINVPDNIQVPVTPVVASQPEINVPDNIQVPVTPVVTSQPEINVPDNVQVPVTPVVTSQPEINVPDNIKVPVTPVVTSQPEINVPDSINVQVNTAVSQPSLNGVLNKLNSIVNLQNRIKDAGKNLQVNSASSQPSLNGVLNRLNSIVNLQNRIKEVSKSLYVMPEGTSKDISQVNSEIKRLQKAIDYVNNNPFELDSSVAQMQVQAISNALDELSAKQQSIDNMMNNVPTKMINAPPEWIPDSNFSAYISQGMERYQQEVKSANDMLNQLSSTQNKLARQAYNVLSPEAFQDMNNLAVRIDNVRNKIREMEANKLNMGTDAANAEMERLRTQLNQAVQQQNELNSAIQRMDVYSINASYQRLSSTIGNTERYIRDNTAEQDRFNSAIQNGTTNANGLVDKIKKAVSVYALLQGAGAAINMSDNITQTTARLNLMNDGQQSTQDLVNMTYSAAQDARGTFTDMADVVARFGNNAKDAFSSNKEVIAFSNLIQKQMTIAGAGTQEASAAMLQLSQAMGSGVLRGDELNSIFEQAPNLIQNIADYLNVPIGEIRNMAEEGQLSADIVKAAVFSASDEINERFEKMPMTFGRMWSSFKNDATMAFQPVLKKMNELGNSSGFQEFVSYGVSGMAKVASATLSVFKAAVKVGNFMHDNWSTIAPIIGGVVTAMLIYKGVLVTHNTIQVVTAGINAVVAASEAWKAKKTFAAVAATETATGAQVGYNAALLACPITWIVIGIIAIIVALIAFAGHVAKSGGTAKTTFGVICGWISVTKAAFINLGLSCANMFLGIVKSVEALGSNIKTAFGNAIYSVESMWYRLLSTALTVIGDIANGLNALPFISIDYEGISAKASQYEARAYEAEQSKQEYKSISQAFNEGYSTFDTYQDNWVQDAYDQGAKSGDKKIKAFKAKYSLDSGEATKAEEYDMSEITKAAKAALAKDAGKASNAKTASNTGKIADNTAKIASNTAASKEDLKYIRDMTETKIINRNTTIQNKFSITNQNTVNNEMDLDGISSGLCDQIKTKIDIAMEGVR